MGCGRKYGQVAMEYLAIFSFAFLLTIPLLIIYTTQTAQLEQDIINAQLQKLSTEIIDSAEEVYFLGEPSQKTIYVTFPSRIQSIAINNSLIIISMNVNGWQYDYIAESRVPISGTLQTFEGIHVITVAASSNEVVLSEN